MVLNQWHSKLIHHCIPIVTWLWFRYLATSVHLWELQCPTVTWLPFLIFPASFPQTKSMERWQGRLQVILVRPLSYSALTVSILSILSLPALESPQTRRSVPWLSCTHSCNWPLPLPRNTSHNSPSAPYLRRHRFLLNNPLGVARIVVAKWYAHMAYLRTASLRDSNPTPHCNPRTPCVKKL